jgi:hypothetical protein
MMSQFLKEHGFWDYTAPGTGGMERFERADYRSLLEDMQSAGMNSLMICVKWLTTGYRSKLNFLDQSATNSIIASDNKLLHETIEEAARRGINVWLGAVVSNYIYDYFGSTPHRRASYEGVGDVAIYDLDAPLVCERGIQLFEELVTLFPGIAGLEVEVEDSGWEAPHRIPLYNTWAKTQGRPAFQELGRPISTRSFDLEPWRDYTTSRRIDFMKQIEAAVRARGFKGKLSMLCETIRNAYSLIHEVNLRNFQKELSHWQAVTYESGYQKIEAREASMEFCVQLPRNAGLSVCYLPRGVMTWTWPVGNFPLAISLQESWRRDIEDIVRHEPETVWWFGCGAKGDGIHVSEQLLAKEKWSNGRDARKALLSQIGNALIPSGTR